MAETAILPPPPRLVGDPEVDLPSMVQWLWDFYNAVVASNAQIEGTALDFDPGDLPDPASSSVAQAQTTANEAYTLAAAAKSLIDTLLEDRVVDSITISGTDTTGAHTFAEAQDDANYKVLVSCVAFTGSPTIDATLVTKVDKTTTGITINLNAAPGAGNSTTFDFLVLRS